MHTVSDPEFGARLRQERERRRITLASVAANTKISIGLLQALERGDVSRWPAGIFRRSFIRDYASAVGLEADVIAAEFLARFPDGSGDGPAPPRPDSSGSASLRLTLVDPPSTFVRGAVLARHWRRWAAAAWDALAVTIAAALVFVGVRDFWMSLALTTIAYYVSSIVILGNTPGVSLFARRPPPETAPKDVERRRAVVVSLSNHTRAARPATSPGPAELSIENRRA
jgi:helix-turn-helix protein